MKNIARLKGSLKGQTVVVAGNGYSLKVDDLDNLAQKYKIFGANRIFAIGFAPDYWTCVDDDMAHSCIPFVMENWVGKIKTKIFTKATWNVPDTYRLRVDVANHFSVNPSRGVVIGGTVTYVNLQLAYYMGVQRVLLIGVDNHYPRRDNDGDPGSKFLSDGIDPDHFKPDPAFGEAYFEKNMRYNRPESDAVDARSYRMANNAFRDAGKQIINITPKTHARSFEKGDIKDWI